MTTMEANDRFLTQEAAESLHDSGMKFVNMHCALSVAHIRLQKSIWLMKPKLHVLIHICKDVRRYRANPRMWHTFIDEDAMRWVKGICARAHPRTRHHWLLKCAKLRLYSMKHCLSRKKNLGLQVGDHRNKIKPFGIFGWQQTIINQFQLNPGQDTRSEEKMNPWDPFGMVL
ncbi:unnamed protein product [Cladocopium goreaui]|uniref:Uncharacterized protein n=1 Tax=Cladocopium goreaui TaxID=2562237 RepID=A0A9P1G7L3_9DINO|nr:unnamed protein product [Cladocopium goreaui]